MLSDSQKPISAVGEQELKYNFNSCGTKLKGFTSFMENQGKQ